MLNIFQLNRMRHQKETRLESIYETLLQKAHNKIQSVAEKGKTSSCVYKVPVFVHGLPLFDRDKCIVYLVQKLQHNGFQVILLPEGCLYISWEHVPCSEQLPEVGHVEKMLIEQPHLSFQHIVDKSIHQKRISHDVGNQLKTPFHQQPFSYMPLSQPLSSHEQPLPISSKQRDSNRQITYYPDESDIPKQHRDIIVHSLSPYPYPFS